MSEPEAPLTPAAEERDFKPYPFWNYSDLALFLAAALPALVTAQLLTRALFTGLRLPGRGEAPELLAAQFLGYGLWFVALFLILKTKYGRPFWVSLAWVRPWERIWQHAAWGVALAFGVAAGALFFKTPDIDMPIKHLLTTRLSVFLVGLAAATGGPLCEELAFRGFLLPLLVRSTGAVGGVILAAIPFALLHGPQYGWSWRHLLFIMAAGIAFGWKRYRSGSTAAAAVMHAAYNLTFFAGFVFHGKDLPLK